MFLRLIPLIVGWMPIIAIHASLLVAIQAGVIPACVPYLDGCASISATGRYEPASFIFKPALMTSWTLLVLYWWLNFRWLGHLARSSGSTDPAPRLMLALGVGGALALILYVTFLGTQAPFYEFMRRFGIYLFFLCTVLAQIILARRTQRFAVALSISGVVKLARIQLLLATVPFALGALNLVLKATLADADPAENIIEWVFALMMHASFILSYYAWRRTDFNMGTSVEIPGS